MEAGRGWSGANKRQRYACGAVPTGTEVAMEAASETVKVKSEKLEQAQTCARRKEARVRAAFHETFFLSRHLPPQLFPLPPPPCDTPLPSILPSP